MFKNSTFFIFSAVFYGLMIINYGIVTSYIFDIDVGNENTQYVASILITFFFGSVTKSLYSFLIDLHVDFEDELPIMYKKFKKAIHGITDLLLVVLMCVFILQISNDISIILYIIFFGFIILSLFLYMLFKSIKNT